MVHPLPRGQAPRPARQWGDCQDRSRARDPDRYREPGRDRRSHDLPSGPGLTGGPSSPPRRPGPSPRMRKPCLCPMTTPAPRPNNSGCRSSATIRRFDEEIAMKPAWFRAHRSGL